MKKMFVLLFTSSGFLCFSGFKFSCAGSVSTLGPEMITSLQLLAGLCVTRYEKCYKQRLI